jgi:hypothetical protein
VEAGAIVGRLSIDAASGPTDWGPSDCICAINPSLRAAARFIRSFYSDRVPRSGSAVTKSEIATGVNFTLTVKLPLPCSDY